MDDVLLKPEGLRERKRRQTLQRIAEVGLSLFLRKGYEATTLDEIAAAAGISRRTFFYYFKSKDEVLLAYLGGYAVTRICAVEPVDVETHELGLTRRALPMRGLRRRHLAAALRRDAASSSAKISSTRSRSRA